MHLPIEDLTPRQIVARLDKYIVGQDDAKRAVAVALRNRFRRQMLPPGERREIVPKNILMMGPTGVGKTEIARRLAQLARAPFVKVEATKFTEVGYVGRDVDSMVRDLVSNAVRLVEQERVDAIRPVAEEAALDRLVDMLDDHQPPTPAYETEDYSPLMRQAFTMFTGQEPPALSTPEPEPEVIESEPAETEEQRAERRAKLRQEILDGVHDDREVEVEVEEQAGNQFLQVFTPGGMEEMGLDMNQLMGGGGRSRISYRTVKVRDAREILVETEAARRLDRSTIQRDAVERAEQTGIIFIDEIDKVAMKSGGGAGPDVSREGVQRDLLPIVEGSTVPTKFGAVNTDHILFICAGAFHESKPSDLIPELQGRLPIRVELQPLAQADFVRILREPQNSLTNQYTKLLGVDGCQVEFAEDALEAIAEYAQELNDKTMNIGARRLHTMLERLLEDFLFDAPELAPKQVTIDRRFVQEELGPVVKEAIKSGKMI